MAYSIIIYSIRQKIMCVEKNKNETLTVCSLVTRRFVFDVLNVKFEVLLDMVR